MPRLVEQQCKECGKWFVYERTGKGRLRHTCSPDCRKAHFNAIARTKRANGEWKKRESKYGSNLEMQCEICKAAYIGDWKSKTCSVKCQKARLAGKQKMWRKTNANACIDCGGVFTGDPKVKRCIGCHASYVRLRRERKENRDNESFIVAIVRRATTVREIALDSAIDFSKTGRPIQSCDSCGKVWLRRKKQERPTCKPCRAANARASRKASKHRRRLRERTQGCEAFDPIEIYERDKWTCQMCGCRVKQLSRYAPNQATLDHIIPLSKGGGHTRPNVQTACHACNSAKADRRAGQMRLIG